MRLQSPGSTLLLVKLDPGLRGPDGGHPRTLDTRMDRFREPTAQALSQQSPGGARQPIR